MPTPDNAPFASSPVSRPSTKIVATIGPASEDRLVQLIEAGLAVARINFSHGVEEDHRRRVEKVRTAARFTGVPIGILADIQGPKMRLGKLAAGERRLDRGQEVRLFEGSESADADRLPFNFPGFRGALKPGDRVLLADGAVELVAQEVVGEDVRASVRRPGLISDRKGVHLPDSYLSQELPTPQDRKHIELAQDLGVDFLGISFVSRAEDLERIRDLAPKMILVAKIERRTALDNLKGILEATDGIMVARGDLGVETALEALPLDLPRAGFRQNEPTFSNATALAAAQAAEALAIHKIICFTESGNTVRLLSRYRVNAEIIAMTPNERTLQAMTILSHVRPILCERETSLEDMLHEAQNLLVERRICLHGEEVIFVAGVPPGVSRSTNVMKLHRIGEPTRMH
ncbi:MAG: pyruvate kinase [Planctomycetota bacterium]|nr:pyruvate kinase [Planctomycetota bacterium]